jgi:hypothetical protein
MSLRLAYLKSKLTRPRPIKNMGVPSGELHTRGQHACALLLAALDIWDLCSWLELTLFKNAKLDLEAKEAVRGHAHCKIRA